MGDKAMTENTAVVPSENIQGMIFTVRGAHVMVDRDLAVVYSVETKVLNQAVKVSISIINAFVEMRRLLSSGVGLLQRLDSLEKRHLNHEIKTDERFEKVFNALEARNPALSE